MTKHLELLLVDIQGDLTDCIWVPCMFRFASVSKFGAKTQLQLCSTEYHIRRQTRHLYRISSTLLACCATQLAESASYKQGRRHELQSLRVVLTVQVMNCRCLCFPLLDAGKELI